MCLAVPGKVVEWLDEDPLLARASVEFGGVRRDVHMAFVPDASLGDYVLVHAGIAIGMIDQIEAAKLRDLLIEANEFGTAQPDGGDS